MAVTIVGNNTPTAGGVVYGDGTNYASTAAGSAGGVLYSAGSSAPAFTSAGTSGQVLQSNGASAPTWVNAVSFATPLTVVGNAVAGAELRLPEDTDNGSNYAAVKAPDNLASNVTCTLPSTTSTLGYINLPAVGTKTGSYVLATTDVGKYVQVSTGGSITIPNATFSEGDVVMIANNTSGGITITCSITSAYIAGTDSVKASVTLATRGIAGITFLSGTVCFITGNVS